MTTYVNARLFLNPKTAAKRGAEWAKPRLGCEFVLAALPTPSAPSHLAPQTSRARNTA